MSFLSEMQNTLGGNTRLPGNYSLTENNGLGYKTTGSALVDLNFAVASLRGMDETVMLQKFLPAFREDELLAMKWLFFARDVRGGLGERVLPRTLFRHIAADPRYSTKVCKLLPLLPEFGRWDDLMSLLSTPLKNDVAGIISKQLQADVAGMNRDESISLCAKWLPSVKAGTRSSALAAELCKLMGVKEVEYRRQLSMLRKHIGVIEQKMSSQRWDEIDYSAVPSRANLLYANAFLRHDEERRRSYLEALEKGEAKINAGTLFPHDIVHRYNGGDPCTKDPALEELWKALPNTVESGSTALVVADGSGSMMTGVGNSGVSALTVANALAIYFAERLQGEFHNKYVTFSSRPQLVDLSVGRSLMDKLRIARQHDEISNTDIEAVFRLILDTATRARMTQEQLPASVLVISDMEFDAGIDGGNSRVFDSIQAQFARAGYLVPRLVFWNVNSRTGTIPVKENDLGVALVSGFSTNLAQMVMSGKTDPLEILLDVLNSERYSAITWDDAA